jgi:hypothetical protein
MKLLANRLSEQTTLAKSLVIPSMRELGDNNDLDTRMRGYDGIF